MNDTLNFADQLLHRARNLDDNGQRTAAARLLARLTRLPELPRDLAEETHARLATIHLDQREPKLARRHLAAAVSRQPDCAHYHYLLAVAVEDDEDCDQSRAGGHYRRCLKLDPEHPDYLCDYGLYAVRQGQLKTGLTSLRRAADSAPDDPETLGRVADGLRQADQAGEAKALLRAALFRHPHDHRFRNLWNQHQFELLHTAQLPPRERAEPMPVILRLPRPKKRTQRVGDKTIRTDGPEKLKGPTILPFHVARRKNA